MMGKEIFRIFFGFHMDPGIYIELTFVSEIWFRLSERVSSYVIKTYYKSFIPI